MPERLADLVALSSGDSRADTLIRLTCGRALSLPPLPVPADLADGRSDAELVLAAFADWLADEGIASISLNPDTVIDTWQRLASR